jgi:hypothetical protein
MKKIHTKVKRKFELSTHKSQYKFFHKTEKIHRPKTFASEALATKWAGEQGLKAGQFTLKKVKHNKRFEIMIAEKPAAKKAK